MNLKHDGLSARLYRWFYEKYQMPETLCPYFWKLVIAYVLCIPFAIITLPSRIFDVDVDSVGERIFISIMLWLCLAGALSVLFTITLFWVTYGEKTFLGGVQRVGVIVLGIAIIIGAAFGIIYLVSELKDRRRRNNSEYIWDSNDNYVRNPNYKEPRPNLVKEFVKAKYHKYCPKINWE